MQRLTLSILSLSLAAAVNAAPAPVEDASGQSSQYGSSKTEQLQRMLNASNRVQLEMQNRIDALQQEVLDLRGITEQQSYQLQQMQNRQRQIYDEISRLSDQLAAGGTAAVAAGAGSAAAAGISSLSEADTYQAAVNLVLKEKEYDKAIPAFESFLAQYPQSSFAANANYWLGQLLFNKSDLAGAEAAFTRVNKDFPKSSKRADSLVKLGMIAARQNQNSVAKGFYQQVLSEYANSAAARLAQQQLDKLP
ncbi:tol-pal system protein YbgF [Paraferrimonas sedimenticola]|uniref:Cell division coordinator CpoB n=1 Tax=Paraferrimonas sedimenticola TaxID=375674 RepID=A0AA37RZR5_9GAMM|nr:tol-pal system protein YbgF [Paraferrimonas sedimenticola]GLP97964.1 tol-pal system protein YbgF [Paraferrimonas sedimenticola]